MQLRFPRAQRAGLQVVRFTAPQPSADLFLPPQRSENAEEDSEVGQAEAFPAPKEELPKVPESCNNGSEDLNHVDKVKAVTPKDCQ